MKSKLSVVFTKNRLISIVIKLLLETVFVFFQQCSVFHCEQTFHSKKKRKMKHGIEMKYFGIGVFKFFFFFQFIFVISKLQPDPKFPYANKTIHVILSKNYRISSNKRWASNKRRPLISAALLGIHIEISASL